jgi:hypothetical protein
MDMTRQSKIVSMSRLAVALLGLSPLWAQSTPEFMSLDSAKPILFGMKDSLPSALKAAGPQISAAAWSAWVRDNDAQIRQRLVIGEQDTLTNLLRFGMTYTREYRIDREYLEKYGSSTLVDSFANQRADDLVRALQSPSANEGMQQMRAFVESQGFSFKTAPERARIKKYLLANLARMRDEFKAYREKLKSGDASQESQLYSERGISLDTDMWPDFALDLQFRKMAKEGMLKAGSIRRVAIVGPGLDFANKHDGNDFYPPQTIQPFAVIDSLARLGLADPKVLELVTFDISPNVNIHIQRARQHAAQQQAYVVQLPWNSDVPWSRDYLAQFTKYWESLGDQIGASVSPLPVPAAAASGTHLRAVAIRPEVVARVTPVDMNVVYQRMPISAPDQQFDLIIGTNIFIYYGDFDQSLARANLASMIRPGGYLLTNTLLANKVPSKLVAAPGTTIQIATTPSITDHIFSYRREP